MEYHKYSLTKKGKSICPACKDKRKTFVLYIDNTTGEPLHSSVGKCDRADKCGHHYSPKQYFQDNHISFDTVRNDTPYRKPLPMPQPAPSYIGADIFKKSLQGYETNALVRYLCRIVGDEAAKKTIGKYFIGTSKNGGTVFWQIDGYGKIHTGKIIMYGKDGHRRKDVMPPVQWVHSLLKLQDFTLSQCFFGEHLLKDTAKPIAIVESEKTAVIASCYLPAFTWLACGGSEGLSPDKCKYLKGREVILYPDSGMYDKWNFKASQLRAICKSVSVSNLIEEQATEVERGAGFDLADYLIRFPLSEIIKENRQGNIEPSSELQIPPTPKQDGQSPAYVSDAGILYIPTPPDGRTSYTTYPSVEAYNKRSILPEIIPIQSVDVSGMKQVFINLNTLTI
ncbi:MAG: DUF6371 domain-containing protein [Tannerellaceae bacterium]|jgi:hypothetical protein|nr:DUF6371 domain-containing protein [Tannerellaceae bacterium]